MDVHRFVHIGDLHLGSNARNADRLRALDQIVWDCREIDRLAAWLWPGDLNHSRMTIEDRNALITRFRLMAEKAPVVVCYGNHDLPGDLDFLAFLDTDWPIYVRSRPDVLRVQLATNAMASIFVLPYPTRAGLVSAGVPSDQVVDTARQALDVIFMAAVAKLDAAAAGGAIPLMVGHVNVGGSIVSTGQPNIGREIELDPALIDRLGRVYVGLNHIHKAQQVGGAHYAGSCCRLDWGEVEEKRYLVVTYGKGDEMRQGATDADGWIYDVESKPLDVAPMYHVEGELTREGFDWHIVGDVLKLTFPPDTGPAPVLDWTGCEVRVRYRFNAAEKSALDDALVRAPFEGAKRLELEPIAMRSRAIRAPEVAAALTLEAKVQTFVRQTGVAWTPSLETKLAALQGPDGAAFLTDVQSKLSEPRHRAGHTSLTRELPVEGAEQRAGSDIHHHQGAL
jgi:DNA repair exonuclease SbcCD nuclease subunit